MSELVTAVKEFSSWHVAQAGSQPSGLYRNLMPVSKPATGEQYSFEVNLDQCTGCKSCVVACHSLNGLDDDESWRDVGMLLGRDDDPYLQTITTACHHCADPACANGCPVLAYDKDPVTGIVRHLDDQCIGCSYCILKCPYDVPKFNKKRGIVRKCDMCQGRLAVGEAPACVQACPNGAIAIRVVRKDPTPMPMMPGLIDPAYTLPQTRYVGNKLIPANAVAADAGNLRVEEAHTPLAVMLVLTQLGAGLWWTALFNHDDRFKWAAVGATILGVNASMLHLGQPLKAWRTFLGWRKSWLSREILAFGAMIGAGVGAALGLLPVWIAGITGLLSVYCSVMVYVDTRREFWKSPATAGKFFGTMLLLGSAAGGYAWLALGIGLVKLGCEAWYLCGSSTSARVMRGPLRNLTMARFALGLLGLCLLPIHSVAALVALGVGEFLERSAFFKAVVAYRMPGS